MEKAIYTKQVYVEKRPPSIETAFAQIDRLLQDPAHDPDWRQEFNDAAQVIENARWQADEGYDIPALIPWEAVPWADTTYIVSPPLTKGGKYLCRLAIPLFFKHVVANAMAERMQHIPVVCLPPPGNDYDEDSPARSPQDTFAETKWDAIEGLKRAQSACVTSTGDLTGIFALWDFIARAGVDAALKDGCIDQSWVHNVTTSNAFCPGEEYAKRILFKITQSSETIPLKEMIEDILFLLPGYADRDPKDIVSRLAIWDHMDEVLGVIISIANCHEALARQVALSAVRSVNHTKKITHKKIIALQALDLVGVLGTKEGLHLAINGHSDLLGMSIECSLIGAWTDRINVLKPLLEKYTALREAVAEAKRYKAKEKHRQEVEDTRRQETHSGNAIFDLFHNAFQRGHRFYFPPPSLYPQKEYVNHNPSKKQYSPEEMVEWENILRWTSAYEAQQLEEMSADTREMHYGHHYGYVRTLAEFPRVKEVIEKICEEYEWPACRWDVFKTHPDYFIGYFEVLGTKKVERKSECTEWRYERNYVVVARFAKQIVVWDISLDIDKNVHHNPLFSVPAFTVKKADLYLKHKRG